MMFTRRPRRTVPKAEPIKGNASPNPLYAAPTDPSVAVFRARILQISALCILGVIGGIAVYGPWLKIESIRIQGTRLLEPSSVEQTVQRYVDRNRWLIIPNQNLWLFSKKAAAKFIQARIESRLAIEGVQIEKQYPHTLTVTIAERVPVVRWSSQGIITTVDRNGIVVEPLNSETVNDQSALPLVVDENNAAIQVGKQIIEAEVVVAIQALAESFDQFQRTVDQFIIPIPACPEPLPVEPPPDENINNADSQPIEGQPTTNTALGNANQPIEPVCDLAALRQQSVEIHAQLADGPRILFDRHQDLQEAVGIVDRVLTQPENQGVQYIDVRFGERVFLR